MNLHLYVIRGQENYGKTTTCWKLFNLLRPQVECYNLWKTSYRDSVRWNAIDHYYEAPDKTGKYVPVDFTTVVRIQNRSHCKIAIVSEGDEPNFVKKRIYELLADDVHHIVCCSRSRNRGGSTYAMLTQEFKGFISITKDLTLPHNTTEQNITANDVYTELMKQ